MFVLFFLLEEFFFGLFGICFGVFGGCGMLDGKFWCRVVLVSRWVEIGVVIKRNNEISILCKFRFLLVMLKKIEEVISR